MMPTDTQGWELIHHTTSTWTSWGISNGRKFKSKTDSSKYIFLPAGGRWDGTSFDYIDLGGYYWFTTINTFNGVDALYLNFSSGYLDVDPINRYSGRSIRAVRSKQW